MKLVKHRYIAFKYYSEENITKEEILNKIWESIYSMFGCIGAAETGLWMIDLDEKNNRGIIRCDLPSLNKVRVAMVLITRIKENKPFMFKILGVSGTIKKAKEKYYN